MTSAISRVLGTFLGGAVGDAIGEPVEFKRIEEIHRDDGLAGVTGYTSDRSAIFSDDTQMTLWTAEGLIRARERRRQSDDWDPIGAVNNAYLRWFLTQRSGVVAGVSDSEPLESGWLIEEPGLWMRVGLGTRVSPRSGWAAWGPVRMRSTTPRAVAV